MLGDVVGFDECEKIGSGVMVECWFCEMWVGGDVVIGCGVNVGEIVLFVFWN